MTKTTRLATGAAIALCALLSITGCTGSKPTHTTPASATSTPPPTPVADPTQNPVGPPASADEAFAAANKTINSFLEMNFEMTRNPDQGAGLIKGYATGRALALEEDALNNLAMNKQRATGSRVTWQANAGLSYTGTVTQSGKSYPNGVAYMVGCADASGVKWTAAPGHTPPALATPVNAAKYTVEYQPDLRIWMITDEGLITGQAGAPQC